MLYNINVLHQILECYINADWASNKSSSKSTHGYLFSLSGG